MNINPALVAAWFGTAITSLAFSSLFLIYISTAKIIEPTSPNFTLYAALPQNSTKMEDSVFFEDARSEIIRAFFKGYKSVLTEYASLFVSVADKYKLDYRLLPAISMQESNGGKRLIKDSFNPFGYGIYGSNVIRFSSWEEGIEIVGRALREDYLNTGLTSPEKIMTKYTPPSSSKGGVWAKGVNSFMEELQ